MASSGDWDTHETGDAFILTVLVASSSGSISGGSLVTALLCMVTGYVVKSSNKPCFCMKSIPTITSVISDLTTTKQWSAFTLPSCMFVVICLKTEMGSPAADTNCSPCGGLASLWLGVTRFSLTNETDDPESTIISTTLLSTTPLIMDPCALLLLQLHYYNYLHSSD